MPRNITVTFADGSSHVYQGAPDDVTPDQVEARASKEFGKKVAALHGGRGAAPEPSMLDSVKQGAGNQYKYYHMHIIPVSYHNFILYNIHYAIFDPSWIDPFHFNQKAI